MNAEKELLLALLIEKYSEPKPTEMKTTVVAQPKIKNRRMRSKPHNWTKEQKRFVLEQRAQGHEFYKIAAALGLRTKQVSNIHYTITKREREAK